MSRAKFWIFVCSMLLGPWLSLAAIAEDGEQLSPAQQAAVKSVEKHKSQILDTNRKIWEHAELGLQERQSSELLMSQLKVGGVSGEIRIRRHAHGVCCGIRLRETGDRHSRRVRRPARHVPESFARPRSLESRRTGPRLRAQRLGFRSVGGGPRRAGRDGKTKPARHDSGSMEHPPRKPSSAKST